MNKRVYICIDLKSFYASVECVERGLNPLTTNLVVADSSRSQKTICLAVSPSLKSFGVPSRPRLFEVIQKVKDINIERKKTISNQEFVNESYNIDDLNNNPYLSLSYLVATPQMSHYIDISAKIYSIYLKYIGQDDIHVYSIDEVFMDVSKYLKTYKMTAHDLAKTIIKDVLNETGITATAGIGTNMYLAKVAMDIVAKKMPADQDGVRIAELDEMTYRKELWSHRPLKDFWRVGLGYVDRLEKLGLYTMGDIAKCSIGPITSYYNEDLLYQEFGVNAELLIDHAWGIEPTTIADIKKYRPKSSSVSSGQVLACAYDFHKGALIVKEMAELLSLDLVDKGLLTKQLSLSIGYDSESSKNGHYIGPMEMDRYGRKAPKGSHGSINLDDYTSSTTELMQAMTILYKKIVNQNLLIKRVSISMNNLLPVCDYHPQVKYQQCSLFDNFLNDNEDDKKRKQQREKERKIQKTIITIKGKYGKNAIVRGMDLEDGGTTIERNKQIGGHKS